MRAAVLDFLRCPYCGTRLTLVENAALDRRAEDIQSGVLGCQCCAFPIVDGIPVLVANDTARRAMHTLEAGRAEEALILMLGLEGARIEQFRALRARAADATYREALSVLSVDAEGEYFLYRFSDPTFLVAEAILRALTREHSRLRMQAIDLCGGSGHLTRVLAEITSSPPILADLYFWKLWLAKQFVAPSCEPVCCDANAPLPYADQTFSLAVCSDAFPYIWHKRLLAGEMMRITEPSGAVIMPHLHSALGENFTAGMTLTPAAYRDLLAPMSPRLFRDSELLDDLLNHRAIDLTRAEDPDALAGEPALAMVGSHQQDVYARYDAAPVAPAVSGRLVVNPLYREEQRDGRTLLRLTFPTAEYEEEFAAVKRYLPSTVTTAPGLTHSIEPEAFGDEYIQLRERRVLLDAPPRYC